MHPEINKKTKSGLKYKPFYASRNQQENKEWTKI